MEKEQIIYWWETFCNGCMCDECESCDLPAVDYSGLIISPPSNYKKQYS